MRRHANFPEGYPGRSATDEAWAEAAAIASFGPALVRMVIEYLLSPQKDDCGIDDGSTTTVRLSDGATCPDGATLRSGGTWVEAPVRGIEACGHEVPELPINRILLTQGDSTRSFSVFGALFDIQHNKDGHGHFRVGFSAVSKTLVPCIGFVILLAKAAAAAWQQPGS